MDSFWKGWILIGFTLGNRSNRNLFNCFQCIRINFGYVVGFCAGIEIFTDGIHVDKAVVCHLDALKVSKKPEKTSMFT